MGFIKIVTTIEDVRAAKPKMIFYGANTCWWTHKGEDLGRLPDGVRPEASLPCDPRGGVLYQTDDVEGFLKNAEEAPEFYGKHGLTAFIAAHNDNCFVREGDSIKTCYATWDEYNAIIDATGS